MLRMPDQSASRAAASGKMRRPGLVRSRAPVHQVGRAAKKGSARSSALLRSVCRWQTSLGVRNSPGLCGDGDTAPSCPGQDRHRRCSSTFTIMKRFSFRPSLRFGAPTGLPYLAS